MAIRHEYPKWKYHADKPACIVHNYEEEEALGDGWADRPDLVAPAAAPDETPAEETDAGGEKPKKRK